VCKTNASPIFSFSRIKNIWSLIQYFIFNHNNNILFIRKLILLWRRYKIQYNYITAVHNSVSVTRVTSLGDLDSTRVTLRKMVTWLNSTHILTEWLGLSHKQWLDTRVRVISTKALNLWWTNPLCLHKNKSAFLL